MEQGNIMICEEKAMATILSDMSFCSTIRYWIDSVCGLTSFLWSITYQSNQSDNSSPFLGIPWAFSCQGGREFDHFIFLGTGHLITHRGVGNLIVSLKKCPTDSTWVDKSRRRQTLKTKDIHKLSSVFEGIKNHFISSYKRLYVL